MKPRSIPTLVALLIVAACFAAAFLQARRDRQAVSLPGSAPSSSSQELPTIELDDAHNTHLTRGNPDTPRYRVAPGPGFIIDGSSYTFRTQVLPTGVTLPNVINIHRRTGTYQVPWQPGETRYEISARTAKPTPASTPGFRPLSEGETFSVFIGFEQELPYLGSNASSFTIGWIGDIVVTASK